MTRGFCSRNMNPGTNGCQWECIFKSFLFLHLNLLLFVVFVQLLNCVQLYATPWTAAHWASLSFTISQSLLNSCPLSQWCHPAIPSSVTPFSSCPQSFPASESYPTSQLFASSGQSSGASASTSVLLKNIQDWFPLGLTGLISLQSKGLLGVFSSTINSLVFSLVYDPALFW